MKSSTRCYRSARQRRNRVAGFSLTEALTGSGLTAMVILGVLTVSGLCIHTGDRYRTSGRLAMGTRSAEDEMLYQLRAGANVLPSATVAGTNVTTSLASLVVSAPGYNSSGQSISTTTNDYIAFCLNKGNVVETIQPGAGSSRPQRTNLLLAKNAQALAFTYKVREQFQAMAAGTFSSVLVTTPNGTPTAFVDGVPQTCTYSASNNTITVNNVPLGADVQVMYTVSPSVTTSLQYVSEVDVTLTLSATDSTLTSRTLVLGGSARLRNRRI